MEAPGQLPILPIPKSGPVYSLSDLALYVNCNANFNGKHYMCYNGVGKGGPGGYAVNEKVDGSECVLVAKY